MSRRPVLPPRRLGEVSDRVLTAEMWPARGLYGGAISRNQLTRGRMKGKIYFVNLQPSTAGDGTHWTLFDTRRKPFTYFDPFGVAPPMDVIRFARMHGTHVQWNHQDVQAYSSSDCGWFCLYIAKRLLRGESMAAAISHGFTLIPTRLLSNDRVLNRAFARHVRP